MLDNSPTAILGDTYSFRQNIDSDLLNKHRWYDLRFMPIYSYESDLGISLEDKIEMLDKVINHLEKRNIHITFTDRILDDIKPWEREKDAQWRYLPVAELQGNNICVNPRNIDFLSVLMSIGHIYGHLVQRMDVKKYKPITDLLEIPKPMDLESHLAEYKAKYGSDYKTDFLNFEKEAFRYAKYTFIEAGINWNSMLEYAMNVYIEADFNELWRWIVESPLKSGQTFMAEFQKLWKTRTGFYKEMPAKKINIEVTPDKQGSLIVVRDEAVY